jgi:hypothetical protein
MVIWTWQADGERPAGPSARAATSRGVIQSLVAATMGGLIFAFISHTVAYVIFTVASIVFLSAVLSPTGLFAAIEGLFDRLGRALGGGLSWTLLAAIFFLFFLPFGLLFRRGRKDSMKRYFEPEAPSYWTQREAGDAPDPDVYRRQF